MDSEGEIIKPASAPKDALDRFISLVSATGIIFCISGVPGFVVYVLTNSGLLALLVALGMYLLFCSFVVHHLVVTLDGILFKRQLGTPKFLAWEDIDSVREVTRAELILHGWFWPLIPSREMTPSGTSLGHYRIAFGERWVYFPPSDKTAFEQLLRANGVDVV